MSVIDNANHNVVSYVSGVTKPFTGQRLATVQYKTVNDKSSVHFGIKRESKAVSLPVLEATAIESNLTVLIPHIRNFLESVQDKIIREELDKGNNVVSIDNAAVSIAACVEYLDNSNESGRITKEGVESWFAEAIEPNLALTLSETLGVGDIPTQAESDKVLAIVAAFKGKIASLAGGKTAYDPKTAMQLQKALKLAPESDALASRFMVRLQKMVDQKPDELLHALA